MNRDIDFPLNYVDSSDPAADALWAGKRWIWVHKENACRGRHCSVHNPSDHPLNKAPLHWRADRALMERICEHGIGHPDPDGLAYSNKGWAEAVHGCDGCCSIEQEWQD